MEYRFKIEELTGWIYLGGFKLGYTHDVRAMIEKTRNIIKIPLYGLSTSEGLTECKALFNRIKTDILMHEGGINCNDKDKQQSLELIEAFHIELSDIQEIDRSSQSGHVSHYEPSMQFKTTLTDHQRAKLAYLLADGGFIPAADKTALIWAIGGENEGNKFQPVKWLKDKQRLREFLIPLMDFSDLRKVDIERHCPELFIDRKGDPIKLAKNKKTLSIDSDKIEEYWGKIATM